MLIDLSVEMLHVGTEQSLKDPRCGRRMLPVHLDFSVAENIAELKDLLYRLLGDDPILYGLILYGLIGNTVANTDEDVEQLALLADLLRPQDRMLFEVATTRAIDDISVRKAAQEYANSEPYRIHATSALAQNTDLKIDTHFVEIRVEPEGDRGIRIEAHYVNRTGASLQMVLPNRARVEFRDGESIRVTLSRKYTRTGVEDLVARAGLAAIRPPTNSLDGRRGRPAPFGLNVALLEAAPQTPGATVTTVADEIWSTATIRR